MTDTSGVEARSSMPKAARRPALPALGLGEAMDWHDRRVAWIDADLGENRHERLAERLESRR